MAKITIDKDKCKGCLLCLSFCPRQAIRKSLRLNKQGWVSAEFIAGAVCLGCARCAVICPDCCIEVYK